jgi:ATP-dependent RNA helicase RhlE
MPFSRFGLFSSITRAIQAKGYTEPTPVQVETIPAVLTGRDVVVSAQTGTGKTAAFALPIINRLGPHRPGGVRVLVIEPTRELAAQVYAEFCAFAQFTDLRITLVQGGVGHTKQRNSLRDGTDIVIATVGRLVEHMVDRTLNFDSLQVLVLDEVDRMLDMGFVDAVKAIVDRCPRKRQTLFFSATIPPAIEEMARFALQNPTRINIGRARTVPASITHAMYPVSQALKFQLLLALLKRASAGSAIVFTRTREGADQIVRRLKDADHSASVLHGDRSQGQRKAALAGFKDGYYKILVATDLAARGLDLADVSHVINFDIPLTPDDYVHRVGRTGRSAAVGDAFTLFTPRETNAVKAIERFVRAEIPQVKLSGFNYAAVPAAPTQEKTGPRAKRQRDDAADGWSETTVGNAIQTKRKPAARDEGQRKFFTLPQTQPGTKTKPKPSTEPKAGGDTKASGGTRESGKPVRRAKPKAADGIKKGKAAAQAKAHAEPKPRSHGKIGAHAKGHEKSRPGATNHSKRPPAKSKRR